MINSAEKLTELAYAAMLGESPWQHFLDQLALEVPNGKAIVVVHDNTAARWHIPLASGVDPRTLKRRGAYACANPFIAQTTTLYNGVGVGIVDEALIPLEQLRKTEFYNDFLAPHEMPSRISLTIEQEQDELFILALLSDSMQQQDKLRAAGLLTQLSPHLSRALRYYRRASTKRLMGAHTQQFLDALGTAVLLVGEHSRIEIASGHAEQLMATGDMWRITSRGQLQFLDDKLEASLKAMLSRWYTGAGTLNFPLAEHQVCLVRMIKDSISCYFEGPTVAVLIEEIGRTPQRLDLSGFGAVFQLSAAEGRALAGIIDGKSTQQIAEESARSVETIRSQLKSLYRKTNCHSREDLLKRILALR
ncbi:helix-turn-helix transcriptional regulator [Halomonas cupida]|uniref:helix-turn-helix transcriptional regulator n=1 Tax=Halomonas cupida TaxID=44933 RepID=UPI003A9123F8